MWEPEPFLVGHGALHTILAITAEHGCTEPGFPGSWGQVREWRRWCKTPRSRSPDSWGIFFTNDGKDRSCPVELPGALVWGRVFDTASSSPMGRVVGHWYLLGEARGKPEKNSGQEAGTGFECTRASLAHICTKDRALTLMTHM